MGKFSDEQLEEFRSQCDPVGDAVIERILAAGQADIINGMVAQLIENDDVVPENLPQFAQDYFVETAALPPWADLARMRNGQEFFNKYGPEMALMLSLASLPMCYGCQYGAEVLLRSHRIAKPAGRRILETTQFVLDVMEIGGLEPGSDGRGLRAIQKVRLMHASIRYYIDVHQEVDPFDPAWGKPINQEDLVNTLLSFSRVTVNGLRNLGHHVDPVEEEDFFHVWRVIGFLIGVDEQLNPETAAEGQALLEQICRRNWRPSEAGTELTSAVVEYVQTAVPLRFFDGIVTSILRRAVGDSLSDMLGVAPPNWTRHFLSMGDGLAHVEDLFGRDLGREKLMAFAGRQLLLGFLKMERAKPAAFRIPPSLTRNWV